jgi:hypothetical protein
MIEKLAGVTCSPIHGYRLEAYATVGRAQSSIGILPVRTRGRRRQDRLEAYATIQAGSPCYDTQFAGTLASARFGTRL